MFGPKFGEVKSFYKNQIIFKEGQIGNVGYLIKTGEVTIYKMIDDEQTILNTLGPGEVFGEMGIIDESPRTAFAQAKEYCDLVVIDKKTLHSMLKQSPKLIQSITLLLMKRLAGTLELLDKNDHDSVLPKHFSSICSLLDLLGQRDETIEYHLFLKRTQDITGLHSNQIETILGRLEQLNLIEFDGDPQDFKPLDLTFRITADSRLLLRTAKDIGKNQSQNSY